MNYVKIRRRRRQQNIGLHRKKTSEERHIREQDIQIKTAEMKENNEITDKGKNTYESNQETYSNISRNTIIVFKPIEKDNSIADSNANTISIYNNTNLPSPDSSESNYSTVIVD